MPLTKRALAEFFGTFWLVFGGCGAAVLSAAFPQFGIGFVGVAFAFGLNALHIWLWAAFLIVAGTCVLIIGIAALIALRMMHKLGGMRRTRHSLAEGMSLLRRSKPGSTAKASAKAG